MAMNTAYALQQAEAMRANSPAPTQEAINPQMGPMAEPKDLAILQQALEKKYMESINQREQLASALQANINPQLDLTPFMKYIEGQTGTATGYKAPQDISGKLGQLAQVQRGITQDEIELLKGKISSKSAAAPKLNQWQAAQYGQNAQDAYKNMTKVMTDGYDPTTLKAATQRTVPGAFKGNEAKLMDQAERNFINAILRRQSGASISPAEFDSAEKQYFPRVNDTPEVLEQKEANMKRTIEGLRLEAGPAWEQFSTEGKKAPSLDGASLARQYNLTPEQAKQMLGKM